MSRKKLKNMSKLGAMATALKSGIAGSAAKIGAKGVVSKIPGVGIATQLLWPSALANDDDIKDFGGRWENGNWVKNSDKSSNNDNDYSKHMTPLSDIPLDIESDAYGNSKNGGSGNGSSNKKIIDAIGKGWDDADDILKDTKKSLKSSNNYISNLGKIKNKYIESLDNYKKKNETAIAGNKELIGKNQKGSLDDLSGDMRKSIENTNVMLGLKGANGGSASKMASRAIAKSAGKNRAGILTGYGDEDSRQNQALEKTKNDYEIRRQQAYEWEDKARKEALEEYKSQKEALDRLDNKKSGWSKEDVKAESDKNLMKFIESLNNIQVRGMEFRTNLANKMTEYGGLADELDIEAVNVTPPAELDTPVFSEEIDLENSEDAEDFNDPKNTNKKKVIKGHDALGNPIYGYEDEEEEVTK